MSVIYDTHTHTEHKGLKPQSHRAYTFMNNIITGDVSSNQKHIERQDF